MNINSNSKRSDPLQNLANEYLDDSDKVAYLGGDDSSEYATNELFNKFNNDNINDYYFYINELLFNAENAEKNNDWFYRNFPSSASLHN